MEQDELSFENLEPKNPTIAIPKLLQQARINANKSIEDIADQLRLKSAIIDSLEQEETYNKENLTVFVRGYIRNYAKAVGVSDELIQKGFEEIGIETKIRNVSNFEFKQKPLNQKNSFGKIITYGIIALLIILVLIWRHSNNQTINQPSITTQPIPITAASGIQIDIANSGAASVHPQVWLDPDYVSSETDSGATQTDSGAET